MTFTVHDQAYKKLGLAAYRHDSLPDKGLKDNNLYCTKGWRE